MSTTHQPRDPEAIRIGATLRELREKSGYTVNQFSHELDISYSYLSNIEAGRRPLTKRLLARAAHLLDVPQVAIVREGYYTSADPERFADRHHYLGA